MRKYVPIVLGLALAAAPAAATLIDFDDGVGLQNQVIGAFYSSLGVTFGGATWQDNLGLVGFSGHNALGSTNANAYKWGSPTPVVATFSSAVSTVSLTAIDLGENGFTLNAYDAAVGGNLVDTMTLFGIEFGHNNARILSVEAGSIFRVEMFQAQDVSADGVIVEDFRFAAAPEPGTLLLLTLAVIGGLASPRIAKLRAP